MYSDIDTREGRKKAKTYLDKACALRDGRSCFNAHVVYWKGDWGEADPPRATRLLERSCELDFPHGCFRLGFDLRLRDKYFEAFDALKKACDLNNLAGCYYLAGHYEKGEGVRQSTPLALAALNKSCDGEYASSCVRLGFIYRIGQLVQKDDVKAMELFGKACDLKNNTGCEQFAKLNRGK
jgi:TPR repeat protein